MMYYDFISKMTSDGSRSLLNTFEFMGGNTSFLAYFIFSMMLIAIVSRNLSIYTVIAAICLASFVNWMDYTPVANMLDESGLDAGEVGNYWVAVMAVFSPVALVYFLLTKNKRTPFRIVVSFGSTSLSWLIIIFHLVLIQSNIIVSSKIIAQEISEIIEIKSTESFNDACEIRKYTCIISEKPIIIAGDSYEPLLIENYRKTLGELVGVESLKPITITENFSSVDYHTSFAYSLSKDNAGYRVIISNEINHKIYDTSFFSFYSTVISISIFWIFMIFFVSIIHQKKSGIRNK